VKGAGLDKAPSDTWRSCGGAEEFGPVSAAAESRCANNSATARGQGLWKP